MLEVAIKSNLLVPGGLLIPVIFLELRQECSQREREVKAAAAACVLGQGVEPVGDVRWKSHGDELPGRVGAVMEQMESMAPRFAEARA